MGQNGAKKKKSIYGHLVAADKARRIKKSTDEIQKQPAKKDAWSKNPAFHAFEEGDIVGVCISCGLLQSVHRTEDECHTAYLMRMKK